MRTAAALHAEHPRTCHVEEFQRDILNTCGNFTIIPHGADRQMLGKVEVSERGGFDFARIDIGRSSVRRGNREIRQSAIDPYFLILQTRGRAEMRHAGTVTSLDQGDIFVVDSEQASEFNFQEKRNQQLSFRLPREDVHHRFGEMLKGGLYISHKARESLAFRSAICGAISDDASEAQSEDFFSLLESYLYAIETGLSPSAAVRGQLLSAALGLIGAQFHDPDFTPSELSEALGVPLRTIQRAFNKVGTTPRKAILDTRLRSAHALLPLVRTSHGASSVTDLAYSQGFSDLSYFYREYRRKYGNAPGKEPRFSQSQLKLVGPLSVGH